MKVLSLAALAATIGLIVLTGITYSPVLDSPDSEPGTRILISSVLLLQLYLLFFSVYLTFKIFPVFVWEKEKEESTQE